MADKEGGNPPIGVRAPRQERAMHKVALILEAAMQLLEKGGMPLLTTNAVARTAGVSVGTLYQYFANKDAILDALADREIAALSERVLRVIADPAEMPHAERVSRIVRAVTALFGQRRRVQRIVLEHSLSRAGTRLGPLIQATVGRLTSDEHSPAGVSLSEAEAFVLTNAFVGVMRAMIMRSEDDSPADREIEEALARLITVFAEHGLVARERSA
ncbi:TetR/AcrR family transcriptional regulator [Novosphingobium sp. RD2P27]|uniref:TetR/AcrR family transcriptional regulator n=1 Tax=Novosphingobium kalidii TaxID=3230299 RepID=A0ABV2D024_9SPHN